MKVAWLHQMLKNWFILYLSKLWNILMWDSYHIEYWVEVFRSNRSVVSIMQKLPLYLAKLCKTLPKNWPIIFWPDFLAPLYFQNKVRYILLISSTQFPTLCLLQKWFFFAPILIMNAKYEHQKYEKNHIKLFLTWTKYAFKQ